MSVVILVYALVALSAREESLKDIKHLLKAAPIEVKGEYHRSRSDMIGLHNELSLLMLGGIRFYQIFISSQDMPVCNFIPSCSNFAFQAIRRFGPIKGALLTSDRLQRCHSLAHLYAGTIYKVDETGGRLKDPIERYEAWPFGFSPENILKFGDHLFQEGDYKRAIGEYERYLFFADDGDGRDWATYRIGLSYEMIGEYERALSFYKRLNDQEALYRMGCVYFKMGDFAGSLDVLRRLEGAEGVSERAICLEGAGLMMLGRADRARSILMPILSSKSKDVASVAGKLLKLMPQMESRPGKSPLLAAFLSALLPGAGKIYSGRKYDGLYSLLVVGFSAGMAYDGFKDNGIRSGKGWLFGGAALFFYLGNIYGSAIAAGEFNAGESKRLREEIFGAVGPLLGDFLGDFHAFKARRSPPEHGKP